MDIVCKRPKLELEHGPDYDDDYQNKKEKNYKQIASDIKKRK